MFIYNLYTLDNEFIEDKNYIPKGFTGIVKKTTTGVIYWYKNGIWHREDGPAIIQKSGTKEWLINDKLHRIGGPAIESCLGEEFYCYYIDGTQVSKEQHDLLYSIMKLKGLL